MNAVFQTDFQKSGSRVNIQSLVPPPSEDRPHERKRPPILPQKKLLHRCERQRYRDTTLYYRQV
jgi:hypothetical protein